MSDECCWLMHRRSSALVIAYFRPGVRVYFCCDDCLVILLYSQTVFSEFCSVVENIVLLFLPLFACSLPPSHIMRVYVNVYMYMYMYLYTLNNHRYEEETSGPFSSTTEVSMKSTT